MYFDNIIGELIGVGSNRFVYHHSLDITKVVKVQRPKTFKKNLILNNVIEWNTWNFYLGTEYELLFCPCWEISDDGKYLIQSYAEVLSPDKHLKRSRSQWRKLPSTIKNYPDSKWYKNWGKLEDRYVIIDYGRESADRIRKRFS